MPVDAIIATVQQCVLHIAGKGCKVDYMRKHKLMASPPPDNPDWPKDWREQIKAELADQLEDGATLYGIRSDGTYIARTKHGDQVVKKLARETA